MNLVMTKIKKKIDKFYLKYYQLFRVKLRAKNKIFVIGRNKTGTTSIKKAFLDLGFIIGDQREAEKLQESYLRSDFNPIINYCKSAEVFQDYPFSYPETFKYVDNAYPNSKFILTIRDTPEQWYNSITKFHSKLFGKGNLPTKEDLMNANYVYKGWIWNNFEFMYNPLNDDIYNKEKLIESYLKYNNDVRDYFKDRPNDLMIINLSKKGAYQKFIDFIGVPSSFTDFPWENKTSSIANRN